MSRWTEVFENHPIHETFRSIFAALESPQANPHNGDESEVRRLKKLLTTLYENVTSADLELFAPTALTDLDALIKAHVMPHINNYHVNPDINAFIVPVNNQSIILTNPFYQKKIELTIERKEYLEACYDELANRLNKLNSDLDKSNQTIKTLEIENKRLTAELEKTQKNISTTISTLQTTFTENENSRATTFNDSQNLKNNEYIEWKNKNNENMAEYVKTSREETELKLEQIITDSNTKYETICKLYGIVADKSVTGGYAKVAKEEKIQFNIWRSLSFAFLVLAVSWVIYTSLLADTSLSVLLTSESANLGVMNTGEWKAVIAKISVTLMLLFAIYFCSQQASRHRDELRRAMRLELQMTALDPYIHELEPDEKLEIKKQLVNRFFIGIENFETKEKMHTPANLIADAVFEKVKGLASPITKSSNEE